MDVVTTLKEQWPLLALFAWFGYKWWNSRRVVRLLPALKAKGAVMVDVRSAQEFATGQAHGTINIPLSELGSRLHEISRNVPVVVCCASGTRSGMAKLLLRKNGFSDVHNVGAWTKLA
jgi:rhodanese-related sulfurtransferase